MEIEKYVRLQKNFLDKDTFLKLDKWIKNNIEWSEAKIISDDDFSVSKDIRKVDEFPLFAFRRKNSTTAFWYNYFCHLFYNFAKNYAIDNNLFSQNFLDNLIDLTILKYENSYHYKHHIDYHHTIPRQLSFVFFLNDNFEGGEFEFIFTDKNVKKIKCESNSALIFPSNFMFRHKVHPVTNGIRYTIVGWMR